MKAIMLRFTWRSSSACVISNIVHASVYGDMLKNELRVEKSNPSVYTVKLSKTFIRKKN